MVFVFPSVLLLRIYIFIKDDAINEFFCDEFLYETAGSHFIANFIIFFNFKTSKPENYIQNHCQLTMGNIFYY